MLLRDYKTEPENKGATLACMLLSHNPGGSKMITGHLVGRVLESIKHPDSNSGNISSQLGMPFSTTFTTCCGKRSLAFLPQK